MAHPQAGRFDQITGPSRIRINSEFVASTLTLHECWIDYGHPVRLKKLQWAEDIDDAGREKLEQLLRAYVDSGIEGRKATPFATLKGAREWLAVAEEHRAARDAKPE